MEFNDQFYQNLFQLATSPARKEASAELLRIVNEIKDYYAANGITELWRNAPNMSEQESVPLSVKRVDKPVAPVKREALQTTDPESSKQAQPIDEINLKKELNEIGILEPDSPHDGLDSLKIVANLEEDDESVDVIQKSSDCVVKLERDQSQCISKVANLAPPLFLNLTTSPNDFSVSTSSTPLDIVDSNLIEDESYYQSPSQKIKRVALEHKIAAAAPCPVGKLDKNAIRQENRWVEEPTMACIVCKQLTFKSGNSLLECHECHTWYHQKCHDPHIPDMSDCRTLWYCNKCNKRIKKEAASTSSSATSEKAKSSSKEHGSVSKIELYNRQKEKDLLKEKQRQQFLEAAAKRVEPKHGSSSNVAKPVALLAADFLAKHKNRPAAASALKSSHLVHSKAAFPVTSTSAISGATGLAGLEKLSSIQHASTVQAGKGTSVQAAEKRLQMMKKKAAGKTSLK